MRSIVLIPIVTALGLLLPINPTWALSSKQMSVEQLMKGVDVSVTPGYGMVIDFSETHGLIEQAWLAHIGRFTISSNGRLCPPVATQETCTNVGATLIFVRLIDPLSIPGLPPSFDGGTLLTLLLRQPDGSHKELQIGLHPGSGKPQYTLLNIEPNSNQPGFTSTPTPTPRLLPVPKRQFPTVITQTVPSIKPIQPPESPSLVSVQSAVKPSSAPARWSRLSVPPLAQPPEGKASASSGEGDRAVIKTLSRYQDRQKKRTTQPSNAETDSTAKTQPFSRQNGDSPVAQPTNLELVVRQPDGSEKRYQLLLNSSGSSSKPPQLNPALPTSTLTTNQNQPAPSVTAPANTPKKAEANNVISTTKNVAPQPPLVASTGSNFPPIATNSNPVQVVNPAEDANAAAFGLGVANRLKQIKPGTLTWRQANSAIRLLRMGKSRERAAADAGLSVSVLNQLITWGQSRP